MEYLWIFFETLGQEYVVVSRMNRCESADLALCAYLQVLARPTDSITHIIFKGGRQATVQRYRAYTKEPKPFFVGVGWIVRCRETNEKADETPFFVNPDTIDNGVLLGTGGQGQNNKIVQPMGLSSGNVGKGLNANRRKTLEPKVLFPDAKKASSALPRGQQTLHGKPSLSISRETWYSG